MGTKNILPRLLIFICLFLTSVLADDRSSATLRTSVRFPSDASDNDNMHEESSNIEQISSATQNHATSSSSFSLIGSGPSGLGSSFSNHQREGDKSNSHGFSQGFILTGPGDPQFRVTTYGPPSPVGMKYRLRRPQNSQHNTNIQHRFRGTVLPGKNLELQPVYKFNQGFIDPVHKFPVQHDVINTPFRKYYKKPPEGLVIRKNFGKPKGTYYPDLNGKNEYEENFSKSTSFNDDYNKQYQEFSQEEKERPLKQDLEPFSKPYYENFFTKQPNNQETYRDVFYQPATTKPTPSPTYNLSKYYKKPINVYQHKQQQQQQIHQQKQQQQQQQQIQQKQYQPQPLTEYKSPGKIFSEPLDYARPTYYKSLTPSLSASSTSSGDWTPINAPQGAVPAKSYDIPAPDLSQRRNTLKRGTYEDSLRHDVVVGTNKFNKAGNSEEVVSAVVMVKQR